MKKRFFDQGRAGTLKLGPPLSIPDDVLIEGLQVYEECFEELLHSFISLEKYLN